MKRFSILALLILVSFLALSFNVDAAVRVKGYFRKDGTYVQPHYRSNPDGNPYNNWSFPGNVNPYTGKVAPGNPDTYLKNYYNGSSGGGSTYTPSYNSGYSGSGLSSYKIKKYITSEQKRQLDNISSCAGLGLSSLFYTCLDYKYSTALYEFIVSDNGNVDAGSNTNSTPNVNSALVNSCIGGSCENVCASDGYTYESQPAAERRGLTILHSGVCTEEEKTNLRQTPTPIPTPVFTPSPTLISTPTPTALPKLKIYTQSRARVRSCASTTCKVIWVYDAGTPFEIPSDFDSSQTWFNVNSKQYGFTGYMHQSLFGY